MFSFQNGWEPSLSTEGGHANQVFTIPAGKDELVGVNLRHQFCQQKTVRMGGKAPKLPEVITDPVTFSISALHSSAVKVSFFSRFISSASGGHLWWDFTEDGAFGRSG